MQLNGYQLSILSAASAMDLVDFVIIGANDGKINDPAYPLLAGPLKNKSSIVFIEPNNDIIPMLQHNFKFTEKKKIINAAVGNEENVTLYSIKKNYWAQCQPRYAEGWPVYRAPTGITSTNRDFVSNWINKYKSGNFNTYDAIKSTKVKSKGLYQLLSENSQSQNVDVLQIDAESNDDKVIYACNLETIKPKVIYCEIVHLTPSRSARLTDHIQKNGYVTIKQKQNLLCIKCDIRQN
jgi:FkbM family methyltransferase